MALSNPQGATISGYLNVKEFDARGQMRTNRMSVNTFRISIDGGGRYSLEMRSDKEQGYVTRLVHDGSDTYYVRDEDFPTNIHNAVNAYVSSGNYPYCPWEEQRRLNTLWLAFGSGGYIRDLHNSVMPIPWSNPRRSLAGYGFRFDSELQTNPPHAPRRIQFIRDTSLDLGFDDELRRPEFDVPSTEGRVRSAKDDWLFRKKWWADKTVAGDFNNLHFTNRAGLELPLVFNLKVFYPFKSQLFREHDGVVTNVSDLDQNETFRLPVHSWIRAEDSRFRKLELGINTINYGITNASMWESTNSNKLRAEFSAVQQGAIEAGHYDARSVRGRRIVMTALVLSCGIISPLILFWFSKRNKTTSKSQHEKIN